MCLSAVLFPADTTLASPLLSEPLWFVQLCSPRALFLFSFRLFPPPRLPATPAIFLFRPFFTPPSPSSLLEMKAALISLVQRHTFQLFSGLLEGGRAVGGGESQLASNVSRQHGQGAWRQEHKVRIVPLCQPSLAVCNAEKLQEHR